MRASLKKYHLFLFRGEEKTHPISINTSEFISQKRKQHKHIHVKKQEYEEAQAETIPDNCLIAAPPTTSSPAALGKLFQFGT